MTTENQAGKKPRGRRNETRHLEQIVPEFVNKTPQDMIDSEANATGLMLQHERNLAIIDQKFGSDLPYNYERAIFEVRLMLDNAGVMLIRAGDALITIKEHEEQGTFLDALSRLGVHPRAAQKMMQASLRFKHRPALASLDRGKILELLSEDDETLDALESGGSVAGLKLDDIDKMGPRALRDALRKAREDAKAQEEVHEKLLDIKNQKLDEMDKQFLERTKRVKAWEGVVLEISANLMTMSGAVSMNINFLRQQVEQILQEAENFNLSEAEMGAITGPFNDHIARMFLELHELQAEFDHNLMGYLPVYTAARD